MDTTKELPTVVAFCAGYGGIERGLDLAGVEHRVIAYVEIEAFAIANLVSKMEAGLLPPAPIYTDIKTFPSEIFRGKVSILTGGYPCQPFSAAGKRLGKDDPRHLWPHIRRHIEAIRPAQCFFENVEGHISLGLSTVVSDLEEDGYHTTWGIFSAREVGAPHQRKRVYMLANSNRFRLEKHGHSESTNVSKTSEELADRNGIRCDWRKLPNRTGERSVEIEAQQRPEQSLVRSEVKGCSGDCGKNVAYTCGERLQGSCTPRDFKSKEPKPNEQLTARCNTAHIGSWETEPRLGRVVDGGANRVDRIRMLGNGVVPQTAAKAYTTLTERT